MLSNEVMQAFLSVFWFDLDHSVLPLRRLLVFRCNTKGAATATAEAASFFLGYVRYPVGPLLVVAHFVVNAVAEHGAPRRQAAGRALAARAVGAVAAGAVVVFAFGLACRRRGLSS